MKFKKTLSSVLLTATVFSSVFSYNVLADEISVYLNDSKITFSNTQPTIIDSRTLVPLRGVFDAMGYEVEWDAEEKTAYLTKGNTVIETSESEMVLQTPNGTEEIECDVLPKIIDGSFMVPLRAVSEATGAEVEWDADTRSVNISTNETVSQVLSNEGSSKENYEGTMSVDEKEYLMTLKECTDYIFKFASDNNDVVLNTILFSGEAVEEGFTLTTPSNYYDSVKEKLEVLKLLEAPNAMSEVQDCVYNYIDVLNRAISRAESGSYSAADIEADRKELRENAENYGVKLYNYFIENKVSFENVYGAEILDALKRN